MEDGDLERIWRRSPRCAYETLGWLSSGDSLFLSRSGNIIGAPQAKAESLWLIRRLREIGVDADTR